MIDKFKEELFKFCENCIDDFEYINNLRDVQDFINIELNKKLGERYNYNMKKSQ